MSVPIFSEKILYRTHQHWIIPVIKSLKLLISIVIPLSAVVYFLVYSWLVTGLVFFIASLLCIIYDHYLWHHSYLIVGNQKVTMFVRNGLFSQYSMNVRYRNIRDCAVSKNSIWGYLFKYGTIFIRSSANEGDLRAYCVPKVGKVYALINALSRYSDEQRSRFQSIEDLHHYHQKTEFSHHDSTYI